MSAVEYLTPLKLSRSGAHILNAMRLASPLSGKVTGQYSGLSDLLMVWGAGSDQNAIAIKRHLLRGKHVISWDHGYVGRTKETGYFRMSLDHWHPQAYFDQTPNDPKRWDVHAIDLREDSSPKGHIVLAGLGPKSHKYLNSSGWEYRKLRQLKLRFPNRRIIYRPKPGRAYRALPCETVSDGPIHELLKGASLVVAKHSNVSVDAVIAGVPFECEDGAALWLQQREFTPENRLDFLRRLAHWQYKVTEANEAWEFIQRMIK